MSKGRGNGNSITTGEVIKLNINYLIRNRKIQTNKEIHFRLSWTEHTIKAISVFNEDDIYLRLTYSVMDKATKEVKKLDYKIYIDAVKSNLNKGSNFYFHCPQSGIRCKILYLCYGSEIFKCRSAYQNKIYYSYQIVSKEDRNNKRFFNVERKIKLLNEKRNTINYKGKQTKRRVRLLKLYCQKDYIDELRYKDFDRFLLRFIGCQSLKN